MKTKVQIRFFKMLSILTITALLVAGVSLFAPQHVSASSLVGTITRPGFLPTALALDETRNRLFVFDRATGSVFVYNATTLQALGSVPTTLEDSVSMVVDESAGKLYVGYFGPGVDLPDGIAVINTATAALIKYLPSGGYTYLVKDEARNVVYVSSNFYGVRKIAVASDGLTTVSGITANLYTSMAVNPVTHELFVSNWSQNNGDFFVVNPTTLQNTPFPNMNGFGVAVNWTENKVYVSYCQPAGWEAVCILDRDTNTRTDVHTGNDSTQPMAFNPSVNRMYTNTEVNAIATIFNGSTNAFTNIPLSGGWATVGVSYSTDNVYYIDAAGTHVMKGSTGQIVTTFPVGASCSVCNGAIVINQTSGLVYVINETAAGLVTVIQDGAIVSRGGDTTGVFRPSNGALYLKNKNETGYADVQINYGIGGDYPIVGDWDGNGTATIGIYRNGSFYLRNENTIGFANIVFPFGAPGDQPIAGDWNGDGVDTIGVYRNGTFFLRNDNSAGAPSATFALGIPGDVGIAGDWNGDGMDTTGVFRPSNGALYLKNQNTTGYADIQINYGIAGDKPVTGDWNDDGIDTIGVYRNGQFMLRNSNTIGFADIVFGLGVAGDMPIAGNWDGLP